MYLPGVLAAGVAGVPLGTISGIGGGTGSATAPRPPAGGLELPGLRRASSLVKNPSMVTARVDSTEVVSALASVWRPSWVGTGPGGPVPGPPPALSSPLVPPVLASGSPSIPD